MWAYPSESHPCPLATAHHNRHPILLCPAATAPRRHTPHIHLLPHAATRSLRQERTEALMEYAADNQLTEEEQGLFQTARDVMHTDRRTPVGKQSDDSISSLVANLQHRPISFSSTTRSFQKRPPPGQAHSGINQTHAWTLLPSKQFATDTLLMDIVATSTSDSQRLIGLRPTW